MGKAMNKQICLNRSVLKFMDSLITPESLVLEFGSGWSSRWFAERCRQLMAIETDPTWEERVLADLHELPRQNWQVVRVSTNPGRFVVECSVALSNWLGSDVRTDLVLVDCREDLRMQAATVGWRFLTSNGWLIFDDAQRLRHRLAVNWLHKVAGPAVELRWRSGDIEAARDRLALAWGKP